MQQNINPNRDIAISDLIRWHDDEIARIEATTIAFIKAERAKIPKCLTKQQKMYESHRIANEAMAMDTANRKAHQIVFDVWYNQIS